jgi:hypothetical protein
MLKTIGRVLILIVAVLVILLSVGGIIGAWGINNVVTNVTLKVFSVIEGGAGIVDTAVSRVDTLVQDGRAEVQQTETTITTVAANIQENRPVLTALSERLETRLGPTVDKIQEAVAPARDALVSIGNVVSFANSIPFVQERAPRLEQLEAVLTQVGDLSADLQQLRTTLREATLAKADELTQELVTTLTRLTSRVDNWLGEIQTDIQGIRSDIEAFQARAEAAKSGLLLAYNLVSLVATLLYIWVIYSQIVVIRQHWKQRDVTAPALVAPSPSEPAVDRADTGPSGSLSSEIADRETASPASAETDQTAATDQPAIPIVDAAPDRVVIAEEDLPMVPEPPSPADPPSDKHQSTDV